MIMSFKENLDSKKEVNAHSRIVNEISKVNGTPGRDINFIIIKKIYKIIVLIG